MHTFLHTYIHAGIHVITLIAYRIADYLTCECHGLIQIGDCIFRCGRTHRGYSRAAAVKRTGTGAVQNQLSFSHRDYKKY